MKVEALTVRGCQLAPNCQVNWENVALANEIVIFGVAGATGLLLLVYGIVAIASTVTKFRRLLLRLI